MNRIFAAACCAASVFAGTAQAVTIGNDLIDRVSVDGFTNYATVLDSFVLSEGTLTSWSAYGGRTGDAALLVLSQAGTNYTVEGVFSANLVVDQITTSNISFDVEDGWLLGLYQGTGASNFSSGTMTTQYTSNGSGLPAVGTTFSTVGTTNREYSVSAELSVVPVPAGIVLMLTGLAGLGLTRRKNAG